MDDAMLVKSGFEATRLCVIGIAGGECCVWMLSSFEILYKKTWSNAQKKFLAIIHAPR